MNTAERMKLRRERQATASHLRQQGLTFAEIGRRMGCSAARANAIYLDAEWAANRPPSWKNGMSVRALCVLDRLGLNDRESALAAYHSGQLHPRNPLARNYGWTTHREIAAWLGLPEPQEVATKVCPHCGHTWTHVPKPAGKANLEGRKA